jgi:tRNA wybutosine-synthesizing protein 3
MKETDTFLLQKQKQLSKIDKSSIGEWDHKIIPLCNKINKKKNYYTTSSCSGRIVLLKYSIEKQPGAFLFRTHDKTSFSELKTVLQNLNYDGIIEFQQTSCILHVACKTMGDALELVNKAKLAGWKRSGVMTGKKRFIVELHSTESMSFPIMNNKKLLVEDEFLKLVVEIANNKLERVWNKINSLKELI